MLAFVVFVAFLRFVLLSVFCCAVFGVSVVGFGVFVGFLLGFVGFLLRCVVVGALVLRWFFGVFCVLMFLFGGFWCFSLLCF